MRSYWPWLVVGLLASCAPPDVAIAPVPSAVVNIGDRCVGGKSSSCKYNYELSDVDCKMIPVKGVSFDKCQASKIYDWGIGRAQIYIADREDTRYTMRLFYSRELTGNGGGVGRSQAISAPTMWKHSILFDDGTDVRNVAIAWDKGDSFAVDFLSQDHPCKGFSVDGPVAFRPPNRIWGARAFYCSRSTVPVSLDDFDAFRTALKYQ